MSGIRNGVRSEGIRSTRLNLPSVKAGQAADIAKVVAANSGVVIVSGVDVKTPRPLPEEVRRLLRD